MIIAKPVVDKKFWILTDEHGKRGNIEHEGKVYKVLFNNSYTYYKNISSIRKDIPFEFQAVEQKPKKQNSKEVYGFDVGARAHNPVYDVSRQLPIFTKTAKSRSWHAAGYYAIKQYLDWAVERNPKLIMIQRYEYRGPFHTEAEAKAAASE